MNQDHSQSVYRILDASANRAAEGLRSLEEFARFGIDHAELTDSLKSLRHQLAEALSAFSRTQRLAARDTGGDVGTQIMQNSEYLRRGFADVIAAAASRTQQSLRVLEEYGKMLDAEAAAKIEQIRYRCYTLCAELETAVPGYQRRKRLQSAHLYALIDGSTSDSQFAASVDTLLISGVDILQLRDRQSSDRVLIERGKIAAELADQHGALFIMNDRADLALAAGADGVHVGQEELPVSVARQILGEDHLIGVSTHNDSQIKQAIEQGADYIGCGPVFASRTKSFDQHVGPSWLASINQQQLSIPAFAIGGIEASNLDEILAAGFDRIAVTAALQVDDVSGAAHALKMKLTGSKS